MDQLAALYALYQFTDKRFRANSLGEVYDAGLEAIFSVLRCGRASILTFDEQHVMRFVAWRGLSDAYRQAVEGYSPWNSDVQDPQPICIEDIDQADLSDDLKAVLRRERITALAFIPLTADNKLVGEFMTYYEHPHTFTQDEIHLAITVSRHLGFSIERMRAEEARNRAEAALHREHELLQTIIDRIPVMITLYEPDKKVLRLNAAFERLVGWSALDANGMSLMHACYPDEVYRNYVSQYMESCSDGWHDIRMRTRGGADLDTAWANVRLSDGVQLGIGVDITERKQLEAQRELLMAELNHRIKNTLATVMAIAHQSFAKARSFDDARQVFEQRIQALAHTHDRLAGASWTGVPLRELVQGETAPYKSDTGNVRIQGPDLTIASRCALKLGMAFHELATNAAKHGALSKRNGIVDVTWEALADADEIHIRWAESGGPPVAVPEHRGFGRLMLERALAAELHGKVRLDFFQQGLQCFIVLPFKDSVVSATTV